jgi:HlyD family secretion protein
VKIVITIVLSLVGVVIAAAIVAGPQLQNGLPTFKTKPTGNKVRTQTVRAGKLIETIKAPGQIEPHTKVDISAEVAARIEQLPFREGDRVSKGDVVVRLDDRDLKAALASAQARSSGEEYRLQSEKSRLTGQLSALSFAQKQLERKQKLYDAGDLPRKDLDDAMERLQDLQSQVDASKFAISVIESSLQAAKADIDRAKETLSKTVIVAPMDGVITALNAEVGEVVLMGTMNNPGTVIMTIADLSRMILNAEVAESDIARVALGQPAKVHINAYRDQVFSGTVTAIALQRTEKKTDNTGYFKVEVEIDLRGGRILSGLMANVDIEIQTHEGLIVESQAVVDRPVDELPEDIKRNHPLVDRAKKSTSVLYRLVNNKAVVTPVRRGPSDDTNSLIRDGVQEGDLVVVGPYKELEKLKHDDPILDEATVEPSKVAGTANSAASESGGKVSVRISP